MRPSAAFPAGYGGLSLSAGAGLDVSAVDSNAGLSMTGGVLSLGGQNTMTGNLNLGAAVRIDATHMTVNGNPLLALNGALTVNGSLLLENSDSVSWSAGTYNLINATAASPGIWPIPFCWGPNTSATGARRTIP